MAYKRNHSKKCNSWIGAIAVFGVIISGSLTTRCWAAFASNYSMSVGEQFTDNVFFTKDKEHDFITVITATLNLLFAPQGATIPTVNLSISPQVLAVRNGIGSTTSATGRRTQQPTAAKTTCTGHAVTG